MEVKQSSGSLMAMVPQDVIAPFLCRAEMPGSYEAKRKERDGAPYHITIAHSSEVIDKHMFDAAAATVSFDKLFVLGVGRAAKEADEVYYLVVHHPQLNKIRKDLGLAVKPLMHITLGFKFRDLHGVDKGLKSIFWPNNLLSTEHCHAINSLPVLQYIETITGHCDDKLRILRSRNHLQQPSLSEAAAAQVAEDTAALVTRGNFIGAVLADQLQIQLQVQSPHYGEDAEVNMEHVLRGIELYSPSVGAQHDPARFFVKRLVERHNSHEMGQPANDAGKRRTLAILDGDEILMHEMPRNFSWVLPGRLAGISKLRSATDLKGLVQLGVRTVVYFLEKEYFAGIPMPAGSDLQLKYVYCENERVPSLADMERVLRSANFVEGAVAFGCLGGFGRTGTALACYLVQHGLLTAQDRAVQDSGFVSGLPAMNANEAVSYLRSVRPKSIENAFQLSFVHQYVNHLYGRAAQADAESSVASPVAPTAAAMSAGSIGRPHPNIKLIMLCGLPGAGKSTFCELFSSNGLNAVFVNQDQLGRSECEGCFLQAIKSSDVVVLDRTNLTVGERAYWLELSTLSPSQCLCIHLATPRFVCVERAKARKHHPTIREGGGSRIIADAEAKFEAPSSSEKFCQVVTLEDEEDVRNYLKTWNCSRIELPAPAAATAGAEAASTDSHRIELVKFPRTQHLINLGAASRDDLLLSDAEFKSYFGPGRRVEISEKVDGAQLGFSLDENFKVRAQNRSHYVNSKSHSQFQLLDKYIFQHTEALYQVLSSSQYILYGEWLYAKHSIGYTKLPSLFLAFDLYDKESRTFCSRAVLEEKLRGTNISIVPLLYSGEVADQKQLMAMLSSCSQFSDSRLEGLYLKINDEHNTVVKHRSKIVRSDFLCGNSHWSKNVTEKNTVKEEY